MQTFVTTFRPKAVSAPGSDRIFEAVIAETHPADAPFAAADVQGDLFVTGAFDAQEGDEIPININHQQDTWFVVGSGVLHPLASRTGLPMRAQLLDSKREPVVKTWKALLDGEMKELSVEWSARPEDTEWREVPGAPPDVKVRIIHKAEVHAVSLLIGESGAQRTSISCVGGACKCGGACSDDDIDKVLKELNRALKVHRAMQPMSVQDAKAAIAEALGEEPTPSPLDVRAAADAAAVASARHQLEHSGANLAEHERPRLLLRTDGTVVDELELEAARTRPVVTDPREGETYAAPAWTASQGVDERGETVSAPLYSASSGLPGEPEPLGGHVQMTTVTRTPEEGERV